MFLNDVEHEHSIATRQRENEYAKNDRKTLVFVFADNCNVVYNYHVEARLQEYNSIDCFRISRRKEAYQQGSLLSTNQ